MYCRLERGRNVGSESRRQNSPANYNFLRISFKFTNEWLLLHTFFMDGPLSLHPWHDSNSPWPLSHIVAPLPFFSPIPPFPILSAPETSLLAFCCTVTPPPCESWCERETGEPSRNVSLLLLAISDRYPHTKRAFKCKVHTGYSVFLTLKRKI